MHSLARKRELRELFWRNFTGETLDTDSHTWLEVLPYAIRGYGGTDACEGVVNNAGKSIVMHVVCMTLMPVIGPYQKNCIPTDVELFQTSIYHHCRIRSPLVGLWVPPTCSTSKSPPRTRRTSAPSSQPLESMWRWMRALTKVRALDQVLGLREHPWVEG